MKCLLFLLCNPNEIDSSGGDDSMTQHKSARSENKYSTNLPE